VKKEVERLRNETGEDFAGKNVDREYRRKLDEEAQEAAITRHSGEKRVVKTFLRYMRCWTQ
jgi:hypothetical protein